VAAEVEERISRDVNAAAAYRDLAWGWIAVSWTKTMLGLPTMPGWSFTRA